jgi:CheY-like chemotaxis protein
VPKTYSSPLAAFEAFRSEPGSYSAVISDLTMPDLTGLELARRIFAIRPEIPFVLAHCREALRDAAAGGGAAGRPGRGDREMTPKEAADCADWTR